MDEAFNAAAGGDDEPIGSKTPVSKLNHVKLYQTLKSWYLLDDAHSAEWRAQAKADDDFVAGDQWELKASTAMTDENRVPLTFNFTLAFIKAVAGLEIGSRHETVYLPRVVEEGDIVANETISETSKWMGDNCDAADNQSEGFQDTITGGMGWTESRMDWEDEEDGKYIEEKLDPIEMRWDRSARKINLQDARRVWRVRTMTLDEAQAMFPDADPEDLNAEWAVGFDVTGKPKSVEERREKLENAVANDPSNEVHIIQVQWHERECYYRIADPETGQEVKLSEADFKKLQRNVKRRKIPVRLKYAKQYRKVFKQAFLGGTVLEVGPCPDPKRFTLQCITGQLHKSKGTWFGLVKLMRDPQSNFNKWMSQALHIMNTTAKGGVIAERGAFRDITEAQRTYANPAAITLVEKGAISKGQIMQKPGGGLAAPYIQMMQMAQQAIPDVTGINLELLGLREVNQPGVLEAQRKQAAMTILATLFNAKKLHATNIGRVRLHFIQNYLPDGQIIRITGPNGYKGVRFVRDKHLGRYDVIVSDAPTSPNQKEATWTMIMQLSQLPAFQALLTPEVAAQLLDYCPLPSKIVQLFKKALLQPKPEQQMQQQLALAGAQADIAKTQADTDKATASAGLDRAKAILALADAGVQNIRAENEKFNSIMGKLRMGPAFGALMPAPQGEAFAIAPMDQGTRQLPQLPQLPMGTPAAEQAGGIDEAMMAAAAQGTAAGNGATAEAV